MLKKLITFFIFFSATSILLFAETLPRGYRSITLEMSIDEVKEALKNDSFFGYRGERDVSLLPQENRTLIETSSTSFLEKSWFQFFDEKLYTITINFNKEKIDYYSIFSTLTKKYGEPKTLTPSKTIWEDETTRISLEQPISIKYIDLNVFTTLLKESLTQKAATEILKASILDDL